MRGEYMENKTARTAMRCRFGMPVVPKHARCQRRLKDGSMCNEEMDEWGDHCQACRCGPVRYRRHEGCCCLWKQFNEKAGCEAQREVYIPEWKATINEKGKEKTVKARMDVVATPALGGTDYYYDITIRHALNPGNLVDTEANAEWALCEAEKEKKKRYKPTDGMACTPIACLTNGLSSATTQRAIARLACAAQEQRTSQGLARHRLRAKWRLQLSRHLARRCVLAVIFSMRHTELQQGELLLGERRGEAHVQYLEAPGPLQAEEASRGGLGAQAGRAVPP